jgi:hypothetical protein
MSMSEQRESFSAALHEAARSFEPPRPDLLYGDARRRGQRIKRQRTLGAGLTGVVLLAVIGVLAVTFAGSGGGATATAAVPAPTGPVTAQYMAAAFESVLPSNAKLDESAAHPVIGYGYTSQGTDGGWYAGATATVLVSGGAYVFTVTVQTGVMGLGPCMVRPQKSASAPQGTSLNCDFGTLDGGSFGLQTTSADGTTTYAWTPADLATETNRQSFVASVRPAGKGVNGVASPFTVKQIQRLMTAKVWTEVFKDMPAVVG